MWRKKGLNKMNSNDGITAGGIPGDIEILSWCLSFLVFSDLNCLLKDTGIGVFWFHCTTC